MNTADSSEQPDAWHDSLTSFDRLAAKCLVCPKPLYYDPADPESHQEAKEQIHDALFPGNWAVRDILTISKMRIADITTRNIRVSELQQELREIITIFGKRDRAPQIISKIEPLIQLSINNDRHSTQCTTDLWKEGVSILLALETIDSRLVSFSRRFNWLMGGAMNEKELEHNSSRPILFPCAYHCMLFAVAERTLRVLLSISNEEDLFDRMLAKGALMLSALQNANDKSARLQKKHVWLMTSPWAKVGHLYRKKHEHSTRQWNVALDNAFQQLQADLDCDQTRFQDSDLNEKNHMPNRFKKSVGSLLDAIGPKSAEDKMFDDYVIELAHSFIWWIYNNRDEEYLANLPTKPQLKHLLPTSPSHVDIPYRERAKTLPRDRAKLYKAVGIEALGKGSGRHKGARTTVGKGKIEELGHNFPE